MEHSFNFHLNTSGPLSKICIGLGLTSFRDVSKYVQQLPYGRNSNRSDFTIIIKENKGTCSTKHAFLKQIAIENEQSPVKLYIGIYKMTEKNTKGIGDVLKEQGLSYIPEAHTYLKINNMVVDITRTINSETSFESSLLTEEQILPDQIGNHKVDFHKAYLRQWVETEDVPYDFDSIWDIRESCIKALKQ